MKKDNIITTLLGIGIVLDVMAMLCIVIHAITIGLI
jgi:hypothetical protein